MNIIIPKNIEKNGAGYRIIDIDDNETNLQHLAGAFLGAIENKKETISSYIIFKHDTGRYFDIKKGTKALLCFHKEQCEHIYILKKEKSVVFDFPDNIKLIKHIEDMLKNNPNHGAVLNLDGNEYDILSKDDVGDINGAIEATITPFLIIDINYFSFSDSYKKGLVLLDLTTESPFAFKTYCEQELVVYNESVRGDSKEAPVEALIGFSRYVAEFK